jgi:hypothetical protein
MRFIDDPSFSLHQKVFFLRTQPLSFSLFLKIRDVSWWARVTARLHQMVQIIGFATGGMLGARVTERLGTPTCADDDYPPDDGASNSTSRTGIGAWNR